MLTHFPHAVPEIPVSNVDKAAEYYVNVLGFSFDWEMMMAGLEASRRGIAECSSRTRRSAPSTGRKAR
jgi:predicted enzyme related to lactoylglutathione lyase